MSEITDILEQLDDVSHGAGTKQLCMDAAAEIRRLRTRENVLEVAMVKIFECRRLKDVCDVVHSVFSLKRT